MKELLSERLSHILVDGLNCGWGARGVRRVSWLLRV